MTWAGGLALEDVLFEAFSPQVTDQIITCGINFTSLEYVNENLKRVGSMFSMDQIWQLRQQTGEYSQNHRKLMSAASRLAKRGWFKSITKMETLAHDVLAPHWQTSKPEFQNVLNQLYGTATAAHA